MSLNVPGLCSYLSNFYPSNLARCSFPHAPTQADDTLSVAKERVELAKALIRASDKKAKPAKEKSSKESKESKETPGAEKPEATCA